MTRSLFGRGIVAAAILSALGFVGCKPGGVGDPCVPEDEYYRDFSGYSAKEVNIESRSFQCESRICLVNHFQGRVSCPYGQVADDLGLGDTDAKRCHIPNSADGVKVAVNPQLQERQTDAAVYCSCRCSNAKNKTDDGARYCSCPSGFTCQQLISDLDLGSEQLAGGYCVRNGTEWTSDLTCSKSGDPGCCDRNSKSCGKEQLY